MLLFRTAIEKEIDHSMGKKKHNKLEMGQFKWKKNRAGLAQLETKLGRQTTLLKNRRPLVWRCFSCSTRERRLKLKPMNERVLMWESLMINDAKWCEVSGHKVQCSEYEFRPCHPGWKVRIRRSNIGTPQTETKMVLELLFVLFKLNGAKSPEPPTARDNF